MPALSTGHRFQGSSLRGLTEAISSLTRPLRFTLAIIFLSLAWRLRWALDAETCAFSEACQTPQDHAAEEHRSSLL